MAQSDKPRESRFHRDNHVLWHFAPWRSRGARGRLFWFFLLSALALPGVPAWLLGSATPIALLDPAQMTTKSQFGLYNRVMPYYDFPIVAAWVWFAALLGVSLVAWMLAVAAIFLLRLNLFRMGLLEQVYLSGVDRNRAAMGTVAWGAMVGALILLAAFLFQVAYAGYFFPVALGYQTNLQTINGVFRSQPRLETIPFGVGYAFVLLAASVAIWCQAVRGALRQATAPWFDAPRSLAAGIYVLAVILLGVALLGGLPVFYMFGIYYGSFTNILIILSASVIAVMLCIHVRSMSRVAGRICFGPVKMELFVQEDWWESERANRGLPLPRTRIPFGERAGQFMLSLSGVALALFVLSLVALLNDLSEMSAKYPYVVALLGIYAPAAIAIYERLRGPMGNHRPIRGHLIRSVLHGAIPMLAAIGIGLAFFLWIAAGLSDFRDQEVYLVPLITVAFGVGFGLLAKFALIPRRGRTRMLGAAAAIALVLMATPLIIGGMAVFCLGLAALCALPTGLLSVLFQRIHDGLPAEELLVEQSHLEAEGADAALVEG